VSRGPGRGVKRDRQAGLTLIEMLVVLVIVAVMAGVAVLGLGSLDRGSRAEAEARRLADRLQLASDEVLVAGAPLAMLWDPGGYRFVRSQTSPLPSPAV
jgi:general secretion pathway protein H